MAAAPKAGKGRTYVVDQNHPKASDRNGGTAAAPFKTISAAAALAGPGETVLVRAGVYRERVAPARGGEKGRPVTYMAAPGEQVFVRGSEVLKGLVPVKGAAGVYTANFAADVFKAIRNPYATRAGGLPGTKTLGQIIVDGRMLTEMESPREVRRRPGSWAALSDGRGVVMHLPSSTLADDKRLVEYAVRDRIFAPHQRGLGWIVVRGFTFEHCANQGAGGFWTETGQQAGAVSCRAGHHWVVEHCTIRHAKSLGIDIGSEGGKDQLQGPKIPRDRVGYHLIRHNDISDNGEGGLCGLGHHQSRIVGNTFARNNCLGWQAIEEAAIKTHYFFDGVIEGNLFIDNECSGIWLDNVYYGTRITRNVILNSYNHGIFIEMGDGPCLIDNNIIAYTRAGEGIYAHDASGTTIAHNLFYCNSHFGVYAKWVSDRATLKYNPRGDAGFEGGKVDQTAPCGCHDHRLLNNIFMDNYRGAISLPFDTPELHSYDNFSDYNLFINGIQWDWEGIGFGEFLVNNQNGKVPNEAIYKALCKALKAAGLPAGQQPRRDDFVGRGATLLTLDQWRAFTGRDKHSVAPTIKLGPVENGAIAKGCVRFSGMGGWIRLDSESAFEQLACPPVPGITHDINGAKLAKDRVRPGPFQDLRNGKNVFVFWPAPELMSKPVSIWRRG